MQPTNPRQTAPGTVAEQPDPTPRLSRDACYQIVHTLRASLPPPVTDTPGDASRRDNAAIAHVASLLPANTDEANLAALYVAAQACAMECLQLARTWRNDLAAFLKCTARSAAMMQQARSTPDAAAGDAGRP